MPFRATLRSRTFWPGRSAVIWKSLNRKAPNQSLHRTAAQRLGFGCAGMIGRRIRCRRPWSAAVGELWRSTMYSPRRARSARRDPRRNAPVRPLSEGWSAPATRTPALGRGYRCSWSRPDGTLSGGGDSLRVLRVLRGRPGPELSNQSVEATATRSLGLMVKPGDLRGVWGRRASPGRSPESV